MTQEKNKKEFLMQTIFIISFIVLLTTLYFYVHIKELCQENTIIKIWLAAIGSFSLFISILTASIIYKKEENEI